MNYGEDPGFASLLHQVILLRHLKMDDCLFPFSSLDSTGTDCCSKQRSTGNQPQIVRWTIVEPQPLAMIGILRKHGSIRSLRGTPWCIAGVTIVVESHRTKGWLQRRVKTQWQGETRLPLMHPAPPPSSQLTSWRMIGWFYW